MLTEEQAAAFRQDGFLFPFAMLGKDERRSYLAAFARYEREFAETA